MKTMRNDVVRDKRTSKCFNSTLIGHSTHKLKCGDFFVYKEYYSHADSGAQWGTRLAKCHGRVKPINDTKGEGFRILAQVVDKTMTFSMERWVEFSDVIEIVPAKHMLEPVKEAFIFMEKNHI